MKRSFPTILVIATLVAACGTPQGAKLASASHSTAGNKIVSDETKTEVVVLPVDEDNVRCSEVDMWGQSDLLIGIDMHEGLLSNVTAVGRLYDGSCQADAKALISAARASHDSFTVTATWRVYDTIEWGILSEGSDNAQRYCKKIRRTGMFLSGHALFPNGAFQASSQDTVAVLKYEDCVAL